MSQLSDQEAIDVLNTWIAFEVLSPNVLEKPLDLAGGNKKNLTLINQYNSLPWENGGERVKQGSRLFYHLYIGTIKMEKATALLVEKYDNHAVEVPEVKNKAIMAVLTLDQQGRPLVTNLSSYGWAINQALTDLRQLSDWNSLEQQFKDLMAKNIFQYDEEEKLLPLKKVDIENIFDFLNEIMDIPQNLSNKEFFVVKKTDQLNKKNPVPPSVLLNSFYLNDLIVAKNLIENNAAPPSLKRYLGMMLPEKRINILEDDVTLENILAPQNIPLSRWPGKNRNSLVLLQQAAVNIVKGELKHEGILGVNGPPGTGKTTLLRDIIASIITDRAIAMAKFADPAKAFTLTKHAVDIGKYENRLYKIDESLKGFEILIASSNNKAVENISSELPNLKAIAKDASDLRYFEDLASTIFNDECWGIVSAVLGNSNNRNHFSKNFWYEYEAHRSTFCSYLLKASGREVVEYIKDEKGKVVDKKIPDIIINNDAPNNHAESLERWKIVQTEFQSALNKSQSKIAQLENLRQDILKLDKLATEIGLDDQFLVDIILAHQKNKPNFFLRLFRRPKAIEWNLKQNKICLYNELDKQLDIFVQKYQEQIINKSFFKKNHSIKNLTIPWCDDEIQLLRDNLFVQSMKLQKAFIDAAASPIRHNIGIFLNILKNKSIFFDRPEVGQTPETTMDVLPHVWASFFLAVPCISTTFASAGKMLDHIVPGALGWLLIDEAGQAIPQAAIGAITRVKRVVVTGDPLQIEPIVSLPPILTENICAEFNVSAKLFNAPRASVQSLADRASSYYSEFSAIMGDRTIGFPLLVHRRCSNPMFEISNNIAYENNMVHAKFKEESEIRNCLGKSTWFDVKSISDDDKWCQAEGKKIIEILNKLKFNNIHPNLYIITPFKIISNNLRYYIEHQKILDDWVGIDAKKWLKERIGTVHTVQGREADSVIMVLGAQDIEQSGARNWAGKEPNILNVAVTRARENLYIIGNRDLWKEVGVFSELAERLTHI